MQAFSVLGEPGCVGMKNHRISFHIKRQHAKFNPLSPHSPNPVLPGDENFSAISAKDQYSEQLELCNTQPGHPEEVKMLDMLVSDKPPKINGWNPQNWCLLDVCPFARCISRFHVNFCRRNQIYEASKFPETNNTRT